MHRTRSAFPRTRRLTLTGLVLAALTVPSWTSGLAAARPADVAGRRACASRGDFGWAVAGPRNCFAGGHDIDGDCDRLRRMAGPGATVVWFRVDGRGWLVRDPALVGRAVALVEPMAKLGEEQGELGAQQGALGARQGELGVQQGALGARQAELGAELAALELDDRTTASSRRTRIHAQLEQLDRREVELERRQDRMEHEQASYERRQQELDFRQRELERRASRELRALAEEAIAGRRAVRLDTF